MIELVGGAVALAVAYAIGKRRSGNEDDDSDSGCNGHHWRDPEPAVTDADMRYQHQLDVAQYKHLSTNIRRKGVKLRVDATKECEDCGMTTDTTITVGEVSFEDFIDG